MLGLRYDSPGGRAAAVDAMRTINEAAYTASIALARERGSFERFDAERYHRFAVRGASPGEVARRDRARRHSQQPPDGDRARGDDQPRRRQCVERPRARLRARVHAQRAPAGRFDRACGRRKLCAGDLAHDEGRCAAAGYVRHHVDSVGRRAGRDAGGAAAACRQCDLEDHERARPTSRSTNSSASIGAPGSWASKGARCFARMPSPAWCCRARSRGASAARSCPYPPFRARSRPDSRRVADPSPPCTRPRPSRRTVPTRIRGCCRAR